MRDLIRETELTPADFILPLFVRPGKDQRLPIRSMPGQFQLSVDQLPAEIREIERLGIPAVILFGIPDHKDAHGSGASADDGIVQQALKALRDTGTKVLLMTDVCLCEFTDHGHCGVINDASGRIDVDNDATLPLLVKEAVSMARAGADLIAPSGMMDGMIQALRAGLDQHGFTHTPIMSYAAKYASGFYGPFREAAESAPQFGTAAPIRWIPPTAPRRSAKSPSMSRKGPTSSW